MPAIVLVTWQFRMVNARHPHLEMGACVDDRNFRGTLQQLVRAYPDIASFDRAAGHTLQPDKTTIHTTTTSDTKLARDLVLDGHKPRVNTSEVLIGEPVCVHYRHSNYHATTRAHKPLPLRRK